MPTFTYRGFNGEGHRLAGARRFSSESQMKEYLDRQSIQNFEIFASQTKYTARIYGLVPAQELAVFCREMSVVFFSHITLMEGLLLLADQTENKQLKTALSEIHGHMDRGYTFAEAMAMYDHVFTSYLLNMITIGETSGTLDTVFSRMSEYYEKEAKVRKKLKSAITYPVILTVLMAAIIVLLVVKIIPMFQDTLRSMGGEIPAATRVIFAVSSFISHYILWILLVIVIIVIVVMILLRTDKGRLWFDKVKVTIPGGRYVNSRVVTSRFSRSMAILLKSGVQLLNAMEDITNLMDNKFLEGKFRQAYLEIKEGQGLSEVLGRVGIFPALFLKMTVIGQTTGHLDEMLDRSASLFDDEVDESIERLTVMIEPILIILLSVVVGVILLSVILPMISIMTAIG